ncbi:transposase, partial [Alicyclobacillus contaminans]
MPGRKWTVDEKMNIVLEGMMPGANISEVCRRHGVAQSLYYRWREAFLTGGRA